MANLYIISGCNGAGKTTASFTVLPEMLDCDEFINADEIAKGISPINPDKAAIESGRIMLSKIKSLINSKSDFAFETTLATRSYLKILKQARENGYQITLLFFYLDSEELAIERVKTRVEEGGHHIPEQIIRRRYKRGIKNLFSLYKNECDYWMLFDNSNLGSLLIAEGNNIGEEVVKNNVTFENIIQKLKEYGE